MTANVLALAMASDCDERADNQPRPGYDFVCRKAESNVPGGANGDSYRMFGL